MPRELGGGRQGLSRARFRGSGKEGWHRGPAGTRRRLQAQGRQEAQDEHHLLSTFRPFFSPAGSKSFRVRPRSAGGSFKEEGGQRSKACPWAHSQGGVEKQAEDD